MPSSVVPCSRGAWFILGCGHCRSVMTPASLSALKLFESLGQDVFGSLMGESRQPTGHPYH